SCVNLRVRIFLSRIIERGFGMSLSDETAGLSEVAAALGREPEWLKRHWMRLAERHGFPRRHPSGWTWPRAAVAAWLRAGGVTAAPGEHANDNVTTDLEAAYRAALSERYGGEA